MAAQWWRRVFGQVQGKSEKSILSPEEDDSYPQKLREGTFRAEEQAEEGKVEAEGESGTAKQ